jgi:hypothetical protein
VQCGIRDRFGVILVVNGSTSSESSITDARDTILLRDISSTLSLMIKMPVVTLRFEGSTEFVVILCGNGSLDGVRDHFAVVGPSSTARFKWSWEIAQIRWIQTRQ